MSEAELREILSGSGDEGWIDFDLAVVRAGALADGGFLVEAKGLHDGGTVGFGVLLGEDWDPQPMGESGAFAYWGTGLLLSLGAESDSFVTVLDALYGTGLAVSRMPSQVEVTVVGIGDDPRLVLSEPVHMKLFFHPDDEARYAEVFLNVDMPQGRLEFHEKDPEYRRALVEALGVVAG